MPLPPHVFADAKTATGWWGTIKKVGFWFTGLFTAPREIAAMKVQVSDMQARIAAQADPRPVCARCGAGRVGIEEKRILYTERRYGPPSVVHATYGACTSCGATWRLQVTDGDVSLLTLVPEGVPAQQERPPDKAAQGGRDAWMRY